MMFWLVGISNLARRQFHSKNVTILKAGQDHQKEVLRLMEEVFFKTDPSSVYSKVAENSISPVLRKVSLESFHDGVTFVAKDDEDEKIVGAAINAIKPAIPKSSYLENFIKNVESKHERTLLELWKFVAMMPPDLDKYFEGGGSLLDISFLVVDPNYRNRGIAKGLVRNSLKEADDKGLKFVRVDCTSHFTARIASAAGMDRIYEINYTDYRSPRGEAVFQNVTPPHVKVVVYARKKS